MFFSFPFQLSRSLTDIHLLILVIGSTANGLLERHRGPESGAS
jgi:hypothetical protein